MIKKILIIGGTGYLGSNIYRRLTLDGYECSVGDINKPDFTNKYYYVNLLEEESLESIAENFDMLINCTGQISDPINISLMLNTKGIDNLIGIVKKFSLSIIQISTVSVYGTTSFADESTPVNPESPYSSSKYFAEYLLCNNIAYGKLLILRLPNLYGGEQKKGLIAYMLRSSRTDNKLDFNNNGNLERFFLHVDDCALQISLAVKKKLEGTYNLIYSDKYVMKDLVKTIENEKCVRFSTTFKAAEAIENIEQLCCEKLNSILEFSPKNKIIDFIRDTF